MTKTSPLTKYAVEVMWMACGTHLIHAQDEVQAKEIAMHSTVPSINEALEDSLRIVNIYRIN